MAKKLLSSFTLGAGMRGKDFASRVDTNEVQSTARWIRNFIPTEMGSIFKLESTIVRRAISSPTPPRYSTRFLDHFLNIYVENKTIVSKTGVETTYQIVRFEYDQHSWFLFLPQLRKEDISKEYYFRTSSFANTIVIASNEALFEPIKLHIKDGEYKISNLFASSYNKQLVYNSETSSTFDPLPYELFNLPDITAEMLDVIKKTYSGKYFWNLMDIDTESSILSSPITSWKNIPFQSYNSDLEITTTITPLVLEPSVIFTHKITFSYLYYSPLMVSPLFALRTYQGRVIRIVTIDNTTGKTLEGFYYLGGKPEVSVLNENIVSYDAIELNSIDYRVASLNPGGLQSMNKWALSIMTYGRGKFYTNIEFIHNRLLLSSGENHIFYSQINSIDSFAQSNRIATYTGAGVPPYAIQAPYGEDAPFDIILPNVGRINSVKNTHLGVSVSTDRNMYLIEGFNFKDVSVTDLGTYPSCEYRICIIGKYILVPAKNKRKLYSFQIDSNTSHRQIVTEVVESLLSDYGSFDEIFPINSEMVILRFNHKLVVLKLMNDQNISCFELDMTQNDVPRKIYTVNDYPPIGLICLSDFPTSSNLASIEIPIRNKVEYDKSLLHKFIDEVPSTLINNGMWDFETNELSMDFTLLHNITKENVFAFYNRERIPLQVLSKTVSIPLPSPFTQWELQRTLGDTNQNGYTFSLAKQSDTSFILFGVHKSETTYDGSMYSGVKMRPVIEDLNLLLGLNTGDLLRVRSYIFQVEGFADYSIQLQNYGNGWSQERNGEMLPFGAGSPPTSPDHKDAVLTRYILPEIRNAYPLITVQGIKLTPVVGDISKLPTTTSSSTLLDTSPTLSHKVGNAAFPVWRFTDNNFLWIMTDRPPVEEDRAYLEYYEGRAPNMIKTGFEASEFLNTDTIDVVLNKGEVNTTTLVKTYLKFPDDFDFANAEKIEIALDSIQADIKTYPLPNLYEPLHHARGFYLGFIAANNFWGLAVESLLSTYEIEDSGDMDTGEYVKRSQAIDIPESGVDGFHLKNYTSSQFRLYRYTIEYDT